MQLFFLPLLLYLLVLSQKLLAVVIPIAFFGIWSNVLLHLLLLAVVFYELFGVCVLGKGVVSQINRNLLFFACFDLFPDVWLVVADEVHTFIVDSVALAIGYWLLLNYFNLSVFLLPRLCLSLEQLGLEIFLLQLVVRPLSYFALLELQIAGQILS